MNKITFLLLTVVAFLSCSEDNESVLNSDYLQKNDELVLNDFFRKNKNFDNSIIIFESNKKKKDFIEYLRGNLSIKDIRKKYNTDNDNLHINDIEFEGLIKGNLNWDFLIKKNEILKDFYKKEKPNYIINKDNIYNYIDLKTQKGFNSYKEKSDYNTFTNPLKVSFKTAGNSLWVLRGLKVYFPTADPKNYFPSNYKIKIDDTFSGVIRINRSVTLSPSFRERYTKLSNDYNLFRLEIENDNWDGGYDKWIKLVPINQNQFVEASYILESWYKFFYDQIKFKVNFISN